MDEQEILSKAKAQVARDQSFSPDDSRPLKQRSHVSNIDLSNISRLSAEVWAARDAVGQLNPRSPGLLNKLAQAFKKVVQRSLSWYTRSLQAFHFKVAQAIEEQATAINSIERSLASLENELKKAPSKIPAAIEQPDRARSCSPHPSGLEVNQADLEIIREKVANQRFWYHRIELAPGLVTPGVNDSPAVLRLLNLPADCTGMRALDIGAFDGYFAFELERRGADVVAIDNLPTHRTGFGIVKEFLRSKVEHRMANVYDLSAEQFGKFDLVLFLGVLYHLRNPMLALDRIWDVCSGTGRLWVESHVIDMAYLTAEGRSEPLADLAPSLANDRLMQLYPRNELNNDFSNWWAPTLACMEAMLATCNFAVTRRVPNGCRAILECVPVNDDTISFFRRVEAASHLTDKEVDRYLGS
jgi:tRNA (mo5U34)-methyltransferase